MLKTQWSVGWSIDLLFLLRLMVGLRGQTGFKQGSLTLSCCGLIVEVSGVWSPCVWMIILICCSFRLGQMCAQYGTQDTHMGHNKEYRIYIWSLQTNLMRSLQLRLCINKGSIHVFVHIQSFCLQHHSQLYICYNQNQINTG